MPKKNTSATQATQQLHFEPSAIVAAREPMTPAQAADLKILAEEVRDPAAFQNGLSQTQASRRIDVLKETLRLGELPPHTD
ncbi:MAG: DUF3072 domain-containing protein [Methyloceanibacter sp.]|uniref:DUF3072 domain-containing protein n=1 Tax=Methyloceanibacter sp. TaxID=1965321 RepID=UPI003D9BFCA1